MSGESSFSESSEYFEIDRMINEINAKKKRSQAKEKLADYILSFVEFRLSVLEKNREEEKLKLFNLEKKEKELSKHLTVDEIGSLNLNLLYKDIRLRIVREKDDLKEIEKKISRR